MNDRNKIILSIIVASLIVSGALFLVNSNSTLTNEQVKNEKIAGEYKTISAQEFKKVLEKNKNNSNFVLIDVRTKQEYEAGHIDGAKNLDFYKGAEFVQALSKLDKNKTYAIYCRSGHRSGQTLDIMKNMGFKKVYNLDGGINAWKLLNYKVVY